MRVVSFSPQDLPTLSSLQPDGWSDLMPAFEFYTSSEFCYPIKVVADSLTIAIGCAICFEGTAWLAHIVVHPQHRRKGAGSMVVEHLLALLADRNVDTVWLIATEEGYPLYKRIEFTEDCQYVFFATETAPRVVDESGLAVCSALSSDNEQIIALDRYASGEARDRLLKAHLRMALVTREAGTISGVYFPTLGEGLIESLSATAGIALLRYRLGSHNQCVVPADNVLATTWLSGNGYREVRRARRMRRGERRFWHPECVYSRIAGNLG